MKWLFIIGMLIIGITFLLGGIFNWKNAIYSGPQAQVLIDIFGHTIYRVICVVSGVIIVGVAIFGIIYNLC